jgi:integrase
MHYLIANQITIPTNKKDKNGIPVTVIKKLSPQTVNEIIRTGTTALRWAYHNGLTNNDCFSGLIYCHVPPAKRIILTLEQASAVFKSPWKNDSYRLANLTAMFTGMRIGEVQALQLQDIGMDRIYVRHNWAGADGLKVPKNGDTREIPIPVELRDMLLAQANKNPYGRGLGGFVFFGLLPDAPIDNRVWLAALHEVMESLGIPNQRKISFHCWRHLYTARMADVVAERKLQQATGHKTLAMVEHYAAHESEQTFRELGAAANSIFLPVIQQMDE